jgi:hypothetical protein
MLVVSDVHPLSADVSFADMTIFIRANLDDPVIFDLNFDAATDAAHGTGRLLP